MLILVYCGTLHLLKSYTLLFAVIWRFTAEHEKLRPFLLAEGFFEYLTNGPWLASPLQKLNIVGPQDFLFISLIFFCFILKLRLSSAQNNKLELKRRWQGIAGQVCKNGRKEQKLRKRVKMRKQAVDLSLHHFAPPAPELMCAPRQSGKRENSRKERGEKTRSCKIRAVQRLRRRHSCNVHQGERIEKSVRNFAILDKQR